MTETLTGVSPSNTEDLLKQPSLADAAVAGVTGSGEPTRRSTWRSPLPRSSR
jgi:hypothetical protein